MSEIVPKLWSDFDGTAVSLVKKTNPRNWSKYPLPGMDGYAIFLDGVMSTGVEIAGVVSRRPDILARRLATSRSVSKLGLSEYFKDTSQLVHAGSEESKGRYVVEQSKLATIGMIDDKPHKLGAVLIDILYGPDYPVPPHHPIVLGAVWHGRCLEYIERLAEHAQVMANNGLEVSETGPITEIGLSIRSESTNLEIVQLAPYSFDSGIAFGNKLKQIAA